MAASQSSFEIAGLALGVREAVIALIVAVVVYMAIVLWRMRRLKAKTRKKAEPKADAGDKAPAPLDDEADDDEALVALSREARAQSNDAWRAPPGMAEDMVQGALEQEIAILRDEVDALRGELAALRQDMQHEMAQMRATQSVSPIYGDAMQLAHAGYDPAAIAERCGIARAEAELVVALANSQER